MKPERNLDLIVNGVPVRDFDIDAQTDSLVMVDFEFACYDAYGEF